MQAMPVIILRKLILRSVQRKLTIRDTVAITSDQTTIVIIRKSYILSEDVYKRQIPGSYKPAYFSRKRPAHASRFSA